MYLIRVIQKLGRQIVLKVHLLKTIFFQRVASLIYGIIFNIMIRIGPVGVDLLEV